MTCFNRGRYLLVSFSNSLFFIYSFILILKLWFCAVSAVFWSFFIWCSGKPMRAKSVLTDYSSVLPDGDTVKNPVGTSVICDNTDLIQEKKILSANKLCLLPLFCGIKCELVSMNFRVLVPVIVRCRSLYIEQNNVNSQLWQDI